MLVLKFQWSRTSCNIREKSFEQKIDKFYEIRCPVGSVLRDRKWLDNQRKRIGVASRKKNNFNKLKFKKLTFNHPLLNETASVFQMPEHQCKAIQ